MIKEILLALEAGKSAVEFMEKIRADYKRLHEILDNGKDIDQVQNLLELKNIIFGAKTREESLIEKCFSLQEEVIRLKSEIGQKKH